MDETNKTDVENTLPNEFELSLNPQNETDAATKTSTPPPPPSPHEPNTPNPIEEAASKMEEVPSERPSNSPIPETNTDTETTITPTTPTTKMDCEPPAEPVISAQEEPPDPGDESSNQFVEPDTQLKECERIEPATNDDVKNTNDDDDDNETSTATTTPTMTQNQLLIDDSEDLLVPTDYVPDSADIIGDESKRKHSQSDENSETCKKFKHDPLTDHDDAISMHDESTRGESVDEMCTDSEIIPPEINEPAKDTNVTNDTSPPPVDKCETVNDELNITDLLTKGIATEKTLSLVDIIENADDLMQKDNEEESEETSSSDLVDEKKVSEKSSDEVDDVAKDSSMSAEELNFEISEKLKEMGEISLAPVSKSERKNVPEFEGDEVSLEQICKKSADGDDKRNKVSNLRKNIREVMDDNQLDASTLAAQREELERLSRVQEQQRMIREMQRQVQLDRQNSKTQNKVLSLLTGHTSLLKSSTSMGTSKARSAQSPTPMDSSSGDVDDIISGKSGNLTPSVSIAPIKSGPKKSELMDGSDSKGTEPSDTDIDSDDKLEKSDDLLIVEEDSEEDEEDEDDDDVVELKPKSNVVTIVDSSDDDCIMYV